MKLTDGLRRLLVGVASLGLVVVLLVGVRTGVIAYRGADDGVAGTAPADWTGSCATCPLAGTPDCTHCAPTPAEHTTPHVDASKCVGCGKCVEAAPDAFEMDAATRKAKVKDGAANQDIERGASVCPTNAVVR